METFRTILCPVDFSEYSNQAVRYATAFAKQYGSRLIIYHCVQPVVGVTGFPDRIPSAKQAIWDTAAKERMDKLMSDLAGMNIKIESRLASASPAGGILKTASEENADLIVMGTHGLSGYEAILMGSVTNKVLYKTKVPVLAVCKPERTILTGDPTQPLLIRRIMCALDPSHFNPGVLRFARNLARSYQATLIIYTVVRSAEQQALVADLKELVQPDKEEWCKVDFRQSEGNAVPEILHALHEYEIDLLVMGHHSKDWLPVWALGSVTMRVIPQSVCPVLVVRE